MLFRKPQGTPPSEVLRCSFCNKSQRDVVKLIAGPGVYICGECVDICNEIVAEDKVLQTGEKAGPRSIPQVAGAGEPGMPVRCSLCRMVWPPERSVAFPDRGWLCENCVDMVRLHIESPEGPKT
jgi:hypothetical protein